MLQLRCQSPYLSGCASHRRLTARGHGVDTCRCKNTRCSCKGFFLIVAEGSWVLRCRCKHRHTDHDARTHKCTKPNCACHEFHSPWVCNCNHPWGRHKQVILDREVLTLEGMMAACTVEENWAEGSIPHVPVNHFETEVNRFDMLKRGL
mmetsp:Transcript_46584/g.117939  ORF Transcript_46584/g.117939 Transcript_46584/m.117939 type:complete len:149 (+) Transcript_46584:147-593(+)